MEHSSNIEPFLLDIAYNTHNTTIRLYTRSPYKAKRKISLRSDDQKKQNNKIIELDFDTSTYSYKKRLITNALDKNCIVPKLEIFSRDISIFIDRDGKCITTSKTIHSVYGFVLWIENRYDTSPENTIITYKNLRTHGLNRNVLWI